MHTHGHGRDGTRCLVYDIQWSFHGVLCKKVVYSWLQGPYLHKAHHIPYALTLSRSAVLCENTSLQKLYHCC